MHKIISGYLPAIKNSRFILVTILICLLCALSVFSQLTQPPSGFIDKGACPFECCTYRKWQTLKTTTAYAKPDRHSPPVGQFMAGSNVVALTGEVHVIPSRFLVKEPHEKYKRGDVLWVYTYYGEGNFKVWYKGQFYTEDLSFSPYGGGMGDRCQSSKDCWGELDQKLRMGWWVKIKSAGDWVGWTDEAENFSGADACG